jgi:hypothetical protein
MLEVGAKRLPEVERDRPSSRLLKK